MAPRTRTAPKAAPKATSPKTVSTRRAGAEREPALSAVPAAAKKRPAPKSRKPQPQDLDAQVAQVVAALEESIEKKDLSIFYRAFRATDLPILGPVHNANPQGLHRTCFNVLRRLGSISPAVGVAIYNHYAVTCSLSTFPIHNNPALSARRQSMIKTLIDGNLLVANTTSRIHTDKVGTFGTLAERVDKGFRVNGLAAYMSLSTEGDLIFFFTQIKGEGYAIFVAPLPNNPQIEIGPYLFPSAMVDSDTRRVTFHDAFIPEEDMLKVDDSIGAFQVSWHQAMLAAPFLGAAARALEEARKFLLTVRGPDEKPLAELDGMILDIGRLTIQYRSACSISYEAGQALESIAANPPSLPKLIDAYNLSCAAKQVGAKTAEEIVGKVRRIIGGRSFSGTHPLERISQEVMFAPLGGEIDAVTERRIGRLVLGEAEFLSHPW
jgi:alkylation response protein AidB-like acyl-CoA dehydrogenase